MLESLSDTAKGRVYVFFLMITFYGKLSYTAFDIIYCCVRYIVFKQENTRKNKKQQNWRKIKSNQIEGALKGIYKPVYCRCF